MNFIKKVFDGKIDEDTHVQFQKFSRGEFRDRAGIKVKKVKDTWTISTSAEFANDFVKALAQRIENEKVKVTGAIISTSNLRDEPDFKKIVPNCDIKQFMGIKQFKIDNEFTGKEMLSLIEKFPKAFFALTFNTKQGESLKIKPKAPKSAKPKTKDEPAKPEFCKFITKDKEFMKSFVFEKEDFKLAEISHDFLIQDIIIPEELKKEQDFAIVREKSRRKGKILRHAIIDEQKIETEKAFEA